MKRNTRIFFVTFFEFLGFCFTCFGCVYINTMRFMNEYSYMQIGKTALILGIIFMIIPLAEYVIEYFVNKKKAKEYEQWLSDYKFVIGKVLGGEKAPAISNKYGLVVDAKQNYFGSYLKKFMMKVSSIVDFEIHKNGVIVSNSSNLSAGKIKFHSGHAHTTGMDFGTTQSQDMSTYDVYIKTSNNQLPAIGIPCGKDYSAVQTICGLIDIWLENNTTQNEPNAENADVSDKSFNNEITETLRKFKKLFDDGIITAEDFEKKKNELLKF